MNIPYVAFDTLKVESVARQKGNGITRLRIQGCNIARSIQVEQESLLGINSYLVFCIVSYS